MVNSRSPKPSISVRNRVPLPIDQGIPKTFRYCRDRELAEMRVCEEFSFMGSSNLLP